jgi:hypothetical protein
LNFGFSCLRSQERRGHISLFWPRVLLGVLARECPSKFNASRERMGRV